MKKKIFLDLDETLFHADYAGALENHIEDGTILHPNMKVLYTSISIDFSFSDGFIELYRGFLRPNAREFVWALNEEYGRENVFVLTRALRQYAEKFIKQFELDLSLDRIYARDSISKHKHMIGQEGYHAVLVDNLPCYELEDKTLFLRRSGFDKVSTIQVEDFYGDSTDTVLSETLLQQIRDIS
jgi:hypothetical protein